MSILAPSDITILGKFKDLMKVSKLGKMTELFEFIVLHRSLILGFPKLSVIIKEKLIHFSIVDKWTPAEKYMDILFPEEDQDIKPFLAFLIPTLRVVSPVIPALIQRRWTQDEEIIFEEFHRCMLAIHANYPLPASVAAATELCELVLRHSPLLFRKKNLPRLVKSRLTDFLAEGWAPARKYLDVLFPPVKKSSSPVYTWSAGAIKRSGRSVNTEKEWEQEEIDIRVIIPDHIKELYLPVTVSIPLERVSRESVLTEISYHVKKVVESLQNRMSKNAKAFLLCKAIDSLASESSTNTLRIKTLGFELIRMHRLPWGLAQKLRIPNRYLVDHKQFLSLSSLFPLL